MCAVKSAHPDPGPHFCHSVSATEDEHIEEGRGGKTSEDTV